MGFRQPLTASTPRLLVSVSQDPSDHPSDKSNADQPLPPWMDLDFLDRLNALNSRQIDRTDRRMPTDATSATIIESLTSFAHEVRTPLATMHATLEVLSDGHPIDHEDVQQLVRRLQRGVRWISELVENLSALSDAYSDAPFERTPTDVRDWIEQAITLIQPIADQRNQSILLACPHPSPVVDGDAFRLRQMMVNLLTNACRYGAWADTIAISVVPSDATVLIRVSDHGMGILARERDQIFEWRVRGTQTGRQHVQGQGLGLHIVREIVAQHEGSIEVESAVGQGSAFSIRLPGTRAANPFILHPMKFQESEASG
jgi:signal transduction histidine kinase